MFKNLTWFSYKNCNCNLHSLSQYTAWLLSSFFTYLLYSHVMLLHTAPTLLSSLKNKKSVYSSHFITQRSQAVNMGHLYSPYHPCHIIWMSGSLDLCCFDFDHASGVAPWVMTVCRFGWPLDGVSWSLVKSFMPLSIIITLVMIESHHQVEILVCPFIWFMTKYCTWKTNAIPISLNSTLRSVLISECLLNWDGEIWWK